jgi:hypothetical protein
MCPGTDKNRDEKDFTRKVDELLAGQAGKPGEPVDTESQSNLDFAKKIIESRLNPSPVFRDGLKQRLLAKIAEQEVSRSSSKVPTRNLSLWGRLRNLFPSHPVWGMAAATVAVAVLALVVMWQVGVFTPAEHPVMTAQMGGAAVSVEAEVTGLKHSYHTGMQSPSAFLSRTLLLIPSLSPFPPVSVSKMMVSRPCASFPPVPGR